MKSDIVPNESLTDAEDVPHLGHFFVQNRDGLRERAANGSVSGVDKAKIETTSILNALRDSLCFFWTRPATQHKGSSRQLRQLQADKLQEDIEAWRTGSDRSALESCSVSEVLTFL